MTRRSLLSKAAARVAALTAGLVLGMSPAAAARAADPMVAGDILVQLQSTAALGPLLAQHPVTLVSQFGARPIYRLRVIGAADVDDTIGALEANPSVLQAERNAIQRSPEARRASGWTIGERTAYTAQWAPQAMRLPQAQALSTGAGVRVAVLDTGVDAAHPALAGRLMPGFDFVDFDSDPSEVGSAATSVSFGHGTHVAALVALAAPGAAIMPLRVLDADGAGNAWVLAEAMLHAVDPDRNPATNDGAQVINLSLGSFNRTRLLDTIARLSACAIPVVAGDPAVDPLADPGYNGDRERCKAFNGAVVVAAAGNDASSTQRLYPAAEGAYGLLPVAASNADRTLAAFSNSGNWIDVAAPGEGLTSAVPGGGWGTWSGTSMAAPMAAGVAALVKSAYPKMSAKEIARRIVATSAALCGTRIPQVDALSALSGAPPPGCP
jgi:subtilisin family serine protease